MLMEWTSDLSVGVEEIDEQHKELIARNNRLCTAMNEGSGREELLRIMTFLESYIVRHFELEELYMMRHQYPGFVDHKVRHTAFIRSVLEIDVRLTRLGPTDELVSEVGEFLVGWLTGHIMNTDMEMGRFLKAHIGRLAGSISAGYDARRYRGDSLEERELLKIVDGILEPGLHEVDLPEGRQTARLTIPPDTVCEVCRSGGEGRFIIIKNGGETSEVTDGKTVIKNQTTFRVIAGGKDQRFTFEVRPA